MFAGTTARKDFSATLGWIIPPLLIASVLYTLQHTSSTVTPQATQLFRRDEETQCPVDLNIPDACAQVKRLCHDFNDDGLIPYAQIYACTNPSLRPLLLIGLLIWLVVLFASMATAASEFLAVHLQHIVKVVGISENLAGVTVFAFGNGCTDLFSTFAAMGANSGSLAISELFGAAAFITTVVLGLIAWIQPFTVNPREFVGDVIWFMIAASLLLTFLADGQLVLGECIGIIGLYVAFICFALFRSKKIAQTTIHVTATELYNDDAIGEGVDDNLLELETDEAEEESDSSSVQLEHADSPATNAEIFQHPDDPMEQEASDEHLLVAEDSPALQHTSASPILRSFPPLYTWHEQSTGERVFTLLGLPLLFPIGLTTPPCVPNDAAAFTAYSSIPTETGSNATRPASRPSLLLPITSIARNLKTWRLPSLQRVSKNWLLYVQLILGPQFFVLVMIHQNSEADTALPLVLGSLCALLVSVTLIGYIINSPSPTTTGVLISLLAFTTSLIWIYLTATSAVSLLITLAWILNIPTSLLGATVFAVGQSSNDLFANTAIAKRGMPVLAASATFGGPMMNMLIGIGVGGLVQVLKPGSGGVYTFETEVGLFASAACLLLGLAVTLGWVFVRDWRLGGGLGVVLIGLWVCSAVVNVVLSMTV